MTTYLFELGPFAPIGVPLFALTSYVTYRGVRYREFRMRGEWGWHKAELNTFDYWLGTLLNVVFLVSFVIIMFAKK